MAGDCTASRSFAARMKAEAFLRDLRELLEKHDGEMKVSEEGGHIYLGFDCKIEYAFVNCIDAAYHLEYDYSYEMELVTEGPDKGQFKRKEDAITRAQDACKNNLAINNPETVKAYGEMLTKDMEKQATLSSFFRRHSFGPRLGM